MYWLFFLFFFFFVQKRRETKLKKKAKSEGKLPSRKKIKRDVLTKLANQLDDLFITYPPLKHMTL